MKTSHVDATDELSPVFLLFLFFEKSIKNKLQLNPSLSSSKKLIEPEFSTLAYRRLSLSPLVLRFFFLLLCPGFLCEDVYIGGTRRGLFKRKSLFCCRKSQGVHHRHRCFRCDCVRAFPNPRCSFGSLNDERRRRSGKKRERNEILDEAVAESDG
jgi:hypothetical protein